MENLVEVLGSLALVVLSLLAVSLRNFLLEKVKSEVLKTALVRVSDAALVAVQGVAKTYVDDIKRGREDGKLTKEESERARERALDALKHNLGNVGLEEMERLLGVYGRDLDRALVDRIESKLKEVSK